ncbi:cortical protein marker for cell polarity-domain-containing protein, partial [Phycomyces blakesleeanus]
MSIVHFVAWLGCAWILFQSCQASLVTHPNLNFTQPGYLGIAGSYQGISFYTDTLQLTTIPTSTASILSFSSQTFKLLASSSTNGSVYATCVLSSNSSNTLYIGGEFTQFGSALVSNIAQVDLATNTITSLSKGLDGPVYSLLCDQTTNSVYVGGEFLAPLSDAPLYSASLSKYGGSVAVWSNNSWEALPWKGLNGPVYTIAKNPKTNSIMFGGQFDMTKDGQAEFEPDSQPINLAAFSTVSATNTDSVYNDPKSVLCPSEKSAPWHLKTGETGSWEAYFSLSVSPSLIRLANTFAKDSGVKNFSVLSLATNTYFNLSYIDPLTLRTKTCSTQCQLTQSTKLEFQDFIILDSSITYGVRIEIASWYGSGGGLAGVQIYQSEIFVHAVQDLNFPTCTASSPAFEAKVATVGSWEASVPTGSYQHILSTTISADKLGDTSASVDFIPNLPEPGFYEVMLYTPGCGNNTACQQRTQVDLTIYTAPNKTTVFTLNQNNTADASVPIYSGYFVATSLQFSPHITLNVAKSAITSSAKTITLVANAAQWIKSASMSSISSILEYKPNQGLDGTTAQTLSWAPLTETLPTKSIVRALDATDGDLYIGGTFTTIIGTGTGYQNMVRFGQISKKLEPLQSNGLNGPVNALLRSGSDLYIGGNFTSLQGSPNTPLSYTAIYNTNANTWSALGGGVNGPVFSLQSTDNEKSILVSGAFTSMIGSTSSLARQSTGNAWWNLSISDWSANTPLLSGTIYGAFQIDNNLPTSYYIGSINNAQQFQSQGLTFIDGSSTLSTLPFYPDASKPVEINAGALWKNPLNNGTWSTVVAGNFELNNGIYNTAIYDNGVWSGLGSNWKGNVTSMAVHDNFLYMSGEFDANDFTASNFAVYNLVDKSFVLYPELHTLDGTMAKVNVIRPNSIASGIVVGGDFSVAGNVTCKGVCALNPLNHLWTSFGDGISGTVQDMTFTEKTLVVTGDLKISDAVVSMAEYNYQTSGWSSPVVLPGPCSAISYDDGTKNTYIAGKDSSTAYLGIWDGSLFTIPNSTLGPGSVISQMTTVQISSNNSESSSLKTRILNLNQYGNVSFALFDGTAWIPYIVSSSADGLQKENNLIWFCGIHIYTGYLSQGLVIFISVAAGFGIVFVIIAIALSMLFLMRAKENNISPSANPLGYYGKPPRSPQSLIDMLESDKDPKRGSIGTYFDSRFSTMSRNGLTGREMMQTITSFGGSTDGLSATSTYVMPPQIKEISNISQYNHIRPDSSVRPQSELHRISDYSTFNGYGEPMENITPNNYNPFRASAIGIAVTADKPNGPTSSGDYVSRNSNMPSQPSFLNIAPPNTGVFTTQSQVTSNSVSFSSLVPVPASVATAPASSALNLSNLVPTT